MSRSTRPPRHRPRPIVDTMAVTIEMDGFNDRTAAIVGAAWVEDRLALAILTRLRPLDDGEQKYLFEDRGSVLHSFAEKIDIGFALNLYGALVRDDLKQVSSIRNRFAHHLDVRDFDHAEVAGKCDRLNARSRLDSLSLGSASRRTTPPTRREIFTDTVAHLATRLALTALDVHRPPAPTATIGADY